MIRRLTKDDHTVCYELLKTQPAENLFIIGDIETFGYEQDFQKLWGEFNDSGKLIAVLLKYEENYIPYALGTFNAEGFAEIIENDPSFSMISGLKELTEQLEPYIKCKLKRKRQTYYAKCIKLNEEMMEVDLTNVRRATLEDAEGLVELLNQIPEFEDSTTTVEKARRNLQQGASRAFYITENGKMVSTVSTAAENSLSAMVVGVATLEEYKRRGYATKCMIKLCKQLLNEEKELCLFYDNKEAGAIYKRIGFQDIGLWMMYTYEKA